MKTRMTLLLAMFLFGGLELLPFPGADQTVAQEQRRSTGQKAQPEFRRPIEDYRKAIKDAYRVDIANFKDRIKGGKADGKPITNYDLKELLEGIKFEREHTDDSLLALEMAMDHLETVPDYYSRHLKMEQEMMSEKLLKW